MKVKEIILKGWRGEERMWKVFWFYYVLFSFVIVIAYMPKFILESQGVALSVTVHAAYSLTLLIVLVAWLVWIVVSLWRCAFNNEWRVWGYLVRGMLIVQLAYVIREVSSAVT